MNNTYITSRGLLEYRIIGELEREVILFFTGAHANCNTVVGDQEFLVEKGYSILVPSRPGYGKTELSVGETSEDFAHSLTELLDSLQIEKVHVFAFSAGGRPAAQFASRYSERVKKVIFFSAISLDEWPGTVNRTLAPIIFNQPLENLGWTFFYWMMKKAPEWMFRLIMHFFSTLSYSQIQQRISPQQKEQLYRFLITLHFNPNGFHVDLRQSSGDLSQITAPTLIIHSIYDKGIALKHAQHLYENIPNAELYLSEAEHHVLWYSSQAEILREKVIHFLNAS